MQPFNLYPEFYNHPIWLTEDEKENPMVVIEQFFDDVKLIEVRQHLSNMLEACIATSNSILAEVQERDAALYFGRQLEKLVEACHLLNTKN